MVNISVVDFPKDKILASYTVEELLEVLLDNIDYDIGIENFSDKELDYLVTNWKEDYDRLNSLTRFL